MYISVYTLYMDFGYLRACGYMCDVQEAGVQGSTMDGFNNSATRVLY